jgi:hypothetical protein
LQKRLQRLVRRPQVDAQEQDHGIEDGLRSGIAFGAGGLEAEAVQRNEHRGLCHPKRLFQWLGKDESAKACDLAPRHR